MVKKHILCFFTILLTADSCCAAAIAGRAGVPP